MLEGHVMSNATARFRLPFIMPGQAQKEIFHNEALSAIDLALHPAVEGQPLAVPPPDPQLGTSWLVGSGATGEWLGKDGSLASWTSGGRRFCTPQQGMCVWDMAAGFHRRWSGLAWVGGEVPAAKIVIAGQQVLGERQAAVPSPSGGTIIDEEARTAIAAITVALKSHGIID
jgi:hypothetical protein